MCGTDRRIVLGLHRSTHRREQLEHALASGVARLDTAYNYFGFGSHRTLAQIGGDLLPQFTISTKVGFFPASKGTAHSLNPDRLRNAIWRSVDDLGVRPAVIFLHNPERTLAGMSAGQAGDALMAASFVLVEAVTCGLSDRWGIASWEPGPLLPVLQQQGGFPRPGVLMVRAGLSLDAATLDAVDQLVALINVTPANRWGMSPFAGSANDPTWHTTNLAPLLRSGQSHTSLQAAFRLAYELPRVSNMAVGSDNPAHLDELLAATRLQVAAGTITRYRQLIRRPAVTNASL